MVRWATARATRQGLRPRDAAYAIITFWLLAVVILGVIERLADPHTFHTVWLAFWWAIQTVTTVGYGDVVPGNTVGKILAAFLMLGGLSLLSIITATVTSAFVTRRQQEMHASGEDPVALQLEEITARIQTIERELHLLRAGDSPSEPTG